MGRPTKHPPERRTERLIFRLTPAERVRLEAAARKAGRSAADYAREQALTGRVVVREAPGVSPALFTELKRIGVNLNQIARAANQSGRTSARLDGALDQLEAILSGLVQAPPRKRPRPDDASASEHLNRAAASAPQGADKQAAAPDEPDPLDAFLKWSGRRYDGP